MANDKVIQCGNFNERCYCPTHIKSWYGSPNDCCETGRYMSSVEEEIFNLGRNKAKGK